MKIHSNESKWEEKYHDRNSREEELDAFSTTCELMC